MSRSELVRLLALLALLAGCGGAAPRGPETGGLAPPDRAAAARGYLVYSRNCVSCHGELGDGRGPAAHYMEYAPADLAGTHFECRSTPGGSLPLVSDIRRNVMRGLPGRAMPGWAVLGDQQVDDVVEYVRTLSPLWETLPIEPPIPVPPEPEDAAASRHAGLEIYEHLKCGSCHGDGGRGDGPMAPEAMDDGQPIQVTDLTSDPFHCGPDTIDTFHTLAGGHGQAQLDGTPPTGEEYWHLVHFVTSLRRH